MIFLVSTTIDVTWADWRANRPFAFKVPRPNTKTTQKGMCLKPQVVPVRVRTRQWNCTFQCKANMMASDRDTWVCKCLQLIYLSALPFWHLHCNQQNKQFQPNESVLALWLSTRGLNFCGRYDLQESITSDGVWVWVLLRTNRLAMFKAWGPKAKLLRSRWNWPKGILLLSNWHRIHTLQSHRRPVIQYNVGQTWGLLTSALFEFAHVCSWFIRVHST